jgi:hypothetical protein
VGVGAKVRLNSDDDWHELVELAGVEPASANVTGEETTCLFQFMPRRWPPCSGFQNARRAQNGRKYLG